MTSRPNSVTDLYTVDGWNPLQCDFQDWLERAPWRTVAGTSYGSKQSDVATPSVLDDALVQRIYKLDVATFLTAERVSFENMSRLVTLAPDEQSQIFLVTQTADEARHFEIFCNCLRERGVTPDERNQLMADVTTREMQKFYDLIAEQVDKGDFAAAMLAHNVVLEGMAYPIYRYEAAYWSKFDPRLTALVKGAFADEVHHVRFGESIIRRYVNQGDATRNRILKLTHEFHQLMTEVFESTIHHYIHLYQLVANQYRELTADVEIFPGKKMNDVNEKDQVKLLLQEVQNEHSERLQRIGLS